MSQESRTPYVELSSLQNEPSSAHNEPESSETSKKSVDIFSLKEKYNIHLPRSYKEQTSAPQTLSSLQNEPSSAHNEPESSETSKKSVDIFSLKEKYNIHLPRSYKEQTSAPQTVHFLKELESTIPETVDELKTENQKLKKEIAEFKSAENDQLIKNLNRFRKYRILKSILVRSSPGKRVFGNDSEEEDTESDDEKNEKDVRISNSNEMKTIIKTINSEFSFNYDQTFTSANNCEIRRKLIQSLVPKFRPSVTQLTKWLNSIHKSRRATARMCNSGKLLKDLRCVYHQELNINVLKKLCLIKVAKELFRKNDPNITDYNKESLLRMLADRVFHSPEMSDTDEEDHSKTVVNVYDLSWRSAKVSIYF
ncbi:hypothetical protein Glove_194g51 [Diversispora epigaea]|uniref:Uncharacterized protein n=1 Tax=Diversispora epigaea TaxID=1348612 RepID=A0A397ILG2_9GLOM|nr:hypothetical protein Glove_194g51 [Diversispora epigaea]